MRGFIGDEIEMRFAQKPGPPTSFVWRETEYTIAQIKDVSRALDLQRSWWRRRHRDHYVVRTDTGETFEIYFNRGPGRRYWVLYTKLEKQPR